MYFAAVKFEEVKLRRSVVHGILKISRLVQNAASNEKKTST